MPQGILLIDKPEDWTSFDAVNYVRKSVAKIEDKKPKNVKVGHSGTLDPFASGLLILLVGKEYTRKAGDFSKLDKEYEVTLRLGSVSSTGDPEGEITAMSDVQPTYEEVEDALKAFQGEIMQTPPVFSAIKINGQRAYKLARGGKEVIIEPRKVTIHEITLKSYTYPEALFTVHVSSGTYIRSLVSDIGNRLGTGAYTSKLRRLRINGYSVDEAVAPNEINEESLNKWLRN
jgi:tRNA pseudouridine55 synthase